LPQPPPHMQCPLCRGHVDPRNIFRVVVVNDDPASTTSTKESSITYRALLNGERERTTVQQQQEKLQKLQKLQALQKLQELQNNNHSDRPTSTDLRSGRVALNSVKLDALVTHLRRGLGSTTGQGTPTQDTPPGPPPPHNKAVVFSQWTHMLDLIGYVLKREAISFVRVDGSMSQQARQRQLKRFRSRPDIKVLIMSLKAGCLGLNLTCASLVVLMDPWWNPATEHQAMNRCHRIGQTRQVEVLRMIVDGTCEEKMLKMQAMKSKLATNVLTMGEDGRRNDTNVDSKNSLTLDDLKGFFH
jgi:SNF2 family DNA or RNA helicase